jgi:hypothetical protein
VALAFLHEFTFLANKSHGVRYGVFLHQEEAFDFNFDEEGEDLEHILPNAPAITNQIFQRLFRSTAAKLHPDREPDPALRDVKQGLMSDLLKARKTGDVMTILELYQEYVDREQIFSKADEKQLITALEHQIGLAGSVCRILLGI